MEFKGTKGKWTIKGDNNVKVFEKLIACAYGFDVEKEYTYTDETKANVLLISKAPEMLEMLKGILNSKQLDDHFLSMEIKKLIEEATKID